MEHLIIRLIIKKKIYANNKWIGHYLMNLNQK